MARSLRCAALFALLWLAAAPAAEANAAGLSWHWQESPGPEGAYILSLLTTPAGTILAGTENGGLFRSGDAGASWQRVEEGLSFPCCNYNIQALAMSAYAIYAGTWGGGVRLSNDDGLTWYEAGVIPGDSYPIVMAIAICRYGHRAWAGGNFGVARTDDDGANWIEVNDGLPSGRWVRALALRGTVLYAMLDSGIYRLDPEAPAWVPWNDGLPDTTSQWAFGPAADALFLATFEGGVFHLDCVDAVWEAMNDGLVDDNVTSLVEADRTLLAGTMGSGAFRWDVTQRVWRSENEGLWNRDIRILGSHGAHALAGTYGGGLFVHDPGPGTWSQAGEGIRAPLLTSLASDGSCLYAGENGGGVWRSTDGGDTWLEPDGWVEDPFVHDVACDGWGVYAACWSGAWRSTDQGQTWAQSGFGGGSVRTLAVIDDLLYAGTWGGQVYASEDGGDSWIPVGSGLPSQSVTDLARFEDGLLAAIDGGGVYRLPDGSESWAARNDGLPELAIQCLAISGGYLYAGTGRFGVYRWDAADEEWEPAGQDFQAVFCLADTGTELLAGTWGGIWATESGTTVWSNQSAGLREWLPVRAILPVGGITYAGLTGGGVWVAGNPEAAPEPPPRPERRALVISPNPFGDGAEVRFVLDQPDEVRLEIYSIAGRRIATLVESRCAAGLHQLYWDGRAEDGRAAAAGRYFIRLQVGREQTTERIVRLR